MPGTVGFAKIVARARQVGIRIREVGFKLNRLPKLFHRLLSRTGHSFSLNYLTQHIVQVRIILVCPQRVLHRNRNVAARLALG